MNPVAAYISERRKTLGLPASEVGRIAGISGEYVHYIEKGKRKPGFDIAMRILRALRADPLEFLQVTGYLTSDAKPAPFKIMRLVPIISWTTVGIWPQDYTPDHPADAGEWTETDVEGKKVFALRVKDVSMEPEFLKGDVIIVNPHVEAVPGDFVIVKNDWEEAALRQLKKFDKILVLLPLNHRYPDIELKRGDHKYKIIGKVVKKEKRYKPVKVALFSRGLRVEVWYL